MKAFRISCVQGAYIGAQLMEAGACDCLEGGLGTLFGVELDGKCLDRPRYLAGQQVITAVSLALNTEGSRHLFGNLMCEQKQCLRIAVLKLEFDFVKPRRSAARLDSPFIDTQLDVAVVIPYRVDSPPNSRFEDRFQVSACLPAQERLERRPPGGVKIETLTSNVGFPFVSTECGSVPRFIALYGLHTPSVHVTHPERDAFLAELQFSGIEVARYQLGSLAGQVVRVQKLAPLQFAESLDRNL